MAPHGFFYSFPPIVDDLSIILKFGASWGVFFLSLSYLTSFHFE